MSNTYLLAQVGVAVGYRTACRWENLDARIFLKLSKYLNNVYDDIWACYNPKISNLSR